MKKQECLLYVRPPVMEKHLCFLDGRNRQMQKSVGYRWILMRTTIIVFGRT